ncbi:MAG: L-glutamate gamma-semialdehyde dehydrogenase [Schleiferiaceae bacterium]|nr:L-glutamate gamma-semialdehyde dehydrogenase [Schleiferiaceae bacterium]
MPKGFYKVPVAVNEPVKSYAPGSPERKSLQATYDKMWSETLDIPMIINGEAVRTGATQRVICPHDHQQPVGKYHLGTTEHIHQAINTALAAKEKWESMAWEHRASIFLKAAELIAGPYRDRLNAATMINQGKNVFQAEIDAACETIDFLRFNVQYMTEIYNQQVDSAPGIWNRIEHRPLEGFTFAITPFNFTAISANLPASMAMMGNVVVWKPSFSQTYSAHVLMEIFMEAGLPAGVINMIFTDPQETADIVFNHADFSGLHFTGSTHVFQNIWKTIGNNIHKYKTYPRIVGETGGKDFVLAHPSANARQVATALLRGAFEYQGQKCSAASRGYIPSNLWPEVSRILKEDLATVKMGSPREFDNFVNAVIHEGSFDKLASYIDNAKKDSGVEILSGGNYDKSKGYFVEPTVLVVEDPQYVTMREELFGPVLTLYIYNADKWEEVLEVVDSTSVYGLTGAILSGDRYAIEEATWKLRNAAGNFYINDKPTGAVVGQQPFGGARGSGTNDKAGSMQNLLRWVSARTIKETFVTPEDYRYPFLAKDK